VSVGQPPPRQPVVRDVADTMTTWPPALAQQHWLTQVDAPPHWRCIDLISDLHLSANTPETSAAWARYMRATPADAVLLLGDIFEAWVGDDVLESSTAELESWALDVMRECSASRWLGFMPGNRDFLLGNHALGRGGLHGLHDACVLSAFGRKIVLSHGDAHCLDDVDYQQFRRQVRDPAWQQQILARPLAQRQALAHQLRSASEQRKSDGGLQAYADLDPGQVQNLLDQHGCSLLIHGHTHRPALHELASGHQRLVLSDWDLDGEPRAHRAEVLRISQAGVVRIDLTSNT
jgi:UDP-2,3-diacylglucosamine hydrolase